jgi:FkbM family methyltransferase
MTPHFLKLAKYRLDFVRHCFRTFGVFRSCQLYKLLVCSKSEKGKIIRIPARFTGRHLVLRRGTSDIDAFFKIFAWKEYSLPVDALPKSVHSIIDLGSNIGLSVFYFSSQFPEARIVGLEPDAMNYSMLQNNTEGINRLYLIKGGVWKKSCSLAIENPNDRPDSYRLKECNPDTPDCISAFGISDLLKIHHLREIDLLKVDIEGAEIHLFSPECETWLPKVHTLVIELHGEGIRNELLPRLSKYFKRHFIQGENDVFVR